MGTTYGLLASGISVHGPVTSEADCRMPWPGQVRFRLPLPQPSEITGWTATVRFGLGLPLGGVAFPSVVVRAKNRFHELPRRSTFALSSRTPPDSDCGSKRLSGVRDLLFASDARTLIFAKF